MDTSKTSRPSCGVRWILAGVYFITQTVFLHAGETSFWQERRARLASMGKRTAGAQLALLPASAGPASILKDVPFTSALSALAEPKPFRKTSDTGHAALLAALPARLGTARAVHAAPGRRVVYHLQDVHLQEEAQRNIGDAVRALTAEGKIPLVGLEGAAGPMPFDNFRNFPFPEAVREAADFLLERGEISGPAHAAFTDSPAAFVGIDAPDLYDANVEAYRRSRPHQEAFRQKVEQRRVELAATKTRLFSPALRAFDETVERYHGGDIPLGTYVRALGAAGPLDAFPQTRAFLAALALESSLNFSRVQKERAQLLDALVRRLDRSDVDALVQNTLAYRAGDMSHGSFFAALAALCRRHGVPLAQTPAMEAYLRYVMAADALRPEALYAEIRRLETETYRALASASDARAAVEAGQALRLTRKLVDFSLSREEWLEYRSLPARPVEGLEMFEAFYVNATARDGAMTERLLAAMKERDAETAVLVAGGFHGAGLAEKLQAAGVTVVSFVPRLTRVDGEGAAYLSVFAQEKTPLDQFLEGRGLFTAPHPAAPAARFKAGLIALAQTARLHPDAELGTLFGRVFPGPHLLRAAPVAGGWEFVAEWGGRALRAVVRWNAAGRTEEVSLGAASRWDGFFAPRNWASLFSRRGLAGGPEAAAARLADGSPARAAAWGLWTRWFGVSPDDAVGRHGPRGETLLTLLSFALGYAALGFLLPGMDHMSAVLWAAVFGLAVVFGLPHLTGVYTPDPATGKPVLRQAWDGRRPVLANVAAAFNVWIETSFVDGIMIYWPAVATALAFPSLPLFVSVPLLGWAAVFSLVGHQSLNNRRFSRTGARLSRLRAIFPALGEAAALWKTLRSLKSQTVFPADKRVGYLLHGITWTLVLAFVAVFYSAAFPFMAHLAELEQMPVGVWLYTIVGVTLTPLFWPSSLHQMVVVVFAVLFYSPHAAKRPAPRVPDEQLPFVSVVMAVRNEPAEVVIPALETLLALDYPNFEIIVADNSDLVVDTPEGPRYSPDVWKLYERINASQGRIRLVRRDTGAEADTWWAGPGIFQGMRLRGDTTGSKAENVNTAMRAVHPRSQWTFLMDADSMVPPDSLREVVSAALDQTARGKNVGFVQGSLTSANTSENILTWAQSIVDDLLVQNLYPVKASAGAVSNWGHGVLISRKAWEESGGIPHVISEDLAWANRLALLARYDNLFALIPTGEGKPSTWSALKTQRDRWARGTTQLVSRDLWKLWRSGHLTLPEKLDLTYDMTSYLQTFIGFIFMIFSATIWFHAPMVVYGLMVVMLPLIYLGMITDNLLLPAAVAQLIRQGQWRRGAELLLSTPVVIMVTNAISVQSFFGVLGALGKMPVSFRVTPKGSQARESFWNVLMTNKLSLVLTGVMLYLSSVIYEPLRPPLFLIAVSYAMTPYLGVGYQRLRDAVRRLVRRTESMGLATLGLGVGAARAAAQIFGRDPDVWGALYMREARGESAAFVAAAVATGWVAGPWGAVWILAFAGLHTLFKGQLALYGAKPGWGAVAAVAALQAVTFLATLMVWDLAAPLAEAGVWLGAATAAGLGALTVFLHGKIDERSVEEEARAALRARARLAGLDARLKAGTDLSDDLRRDVLDVLKESVDAPRLGLEGPAASLDAQALRAALWRMDAELVHRLARRAGDRRFLRTLKAALEENPLDGARPTDAARQLAGPAPGAFGAGVFFINDEEGRRALAPLLRLREALGQPTAVVVDSETSGRALRHVLETGGRPLAHVLVAASPEGFVRRPGTAAYRLTDLPAAVKAFVEGNTITPYAWRPLDFDGREAAASVREKFERSPLVVIGELLKGMPLSVFETYLKELNGLHAALQSA